MKFTLANLRLVKRRRHANDGNHNDFQDYLKKTIIADGSGYEVFKGEDKVTGLELLDVACELKKLHDTVKSVLP